MRAAAYGRGRRAPQGGASVILAVSGRARRGYHGVAMTTTALRRRLLDWYDRHARALPWRVSPAARAKGVRPDPYRVWLSEVMLQQTTIPHATGYFLDF